MLYHTASDSPSSSSAAVRADREDISKSRWPLWLSLALLSLLTLLYFVWPAFHEQANQGFRALSSGEQARVSNWVRQFDPWGPFVIVVTMTLQMFLVVVPSVILLAVSVLAYGAWWGSILGVGSVLVASSIGYWIGAAVGPLTIDRLVGKRQRDGLEKYIDRYGYWTVVVFRVSPILSNDAISFVGGLLSMGFWRFLGATALGIAPLVGLIAYFGQSTDETESILLVLSGVSAAALIAYVLYDRKHRPRDA